MDRPTSIDHRVPSRPRLGLVGMAYGGYNLGEELGPAKLEQMRRWLDDGSLDLAPAREFVLTEAGARAAGRQLAEQQVDGILVVLTTFVPDYFLVELLRECDAPVYLWAVEREMQCLSVVCGPLITATLYNLRKHYRLVGADIPDAAARQDLAVFARAALLRRLLRTMRVGFCGGKCPIMFSLSTDEYTLQRQFGATVVNLPIEEFYELAERVPETEVQARWAQLKTGVGQVTAAEADGLRATRYSVAARQLADRHRLGALSLNCFPHLKSQICLGLAELNDAGIAAACEGDLHSTMLMHLLQRLTGRPSFNGDWLRMYPATHEVLFSHCGCGALSLAAGPRDVCLRCSMETKDGLAICYATQMRGPVTLLNLMLGPERLRLAALGGEGVETDLAYEGTPLKVRFQEDVPGILQRIAQCGAGHHWNGGTGDYLAEFAMLCEWTGVAFHRVAG